MRVVAEGASTLANPTRRQRNLVVSHQLEEPNRISGVGLTECDSHGLDGRQGLDDAWVDGRRRFPYREPIPVKSYARAVKALA